MSENEPKKPSRDNERGLALKERTKTKKPPMYKVLLHNDDYTTRDFVVMILRTVFLKSDSDAVAIMMHVHNGGVGVAGIYTREIAETKAEKTVSLAQANEFPLQCSVEPAE